MPKWQRDAKEFTVGVSFNEKRGYQAVIPKPVMAYLSDPDHLTFVIGKKRVEIRAAGPAR
ncbi:MAG: hypothetical protein ACLPWO_02930 [Thermoplasmata archaeon]